MLVALALEVEDMALENSLEKRQRCCSKQHLDSSLVSLPSLLSLEERSEDPFRAPEVFGVWGSEFEFRVFLSLELELELDFPLSFEHSFLIWGVSQATLQYHSQ